MAGVLTGSPGLTAGCLDQADRATAALVVPCSAAKARGGRSPSAANQSAVPQELLLARARVLGAAPADARELLPAWRRYDGGFYRSAGSALAGAAQSGMW